MIWRSQYRDEHIGKTDYFKVTEKISYIEGNEFLQHPLIQIFIVVSQNESQNAIRFYNWVIHYQKELLEGWIRCLALQYRERCLQGGCIPYHREERVDNR